MYSRVFVCLIGAVYIYFQVLAAVEDDIYIAELMVESNVTLEAYTILSIFNSATDLQVSDTNATNHTVILSNTELLADCLIMGIETNCSCSTGYVWSNTVCYNYNCCRETPCLQNVSYITPLCIAKVDVYINGSITLNPSSTWDADQTTTLLTNLEELNAFESLNVTGQRLVDNIVDFEAVVSALFPTAILQTIINNLEASLGVALQVVTEGLVNIEFPETSVCYKSTPYLKCTFEEPTSSAGWNMSTTFSHFELNSGTVVNVDHHCDTEEYKSCIILRLQNVTGIWSGLYQCGFISGSVRHTAKAPLKVILLPDEITLKIDPIAVDCFGRPSTDTVPVTVTAIILKKPENYEVWWSYMDEQELNPSNMSVGEYVLFTFIANVGCQKIEEPHTVSVTFKNIKKQIQSEEVTIPVIYEGENFCEGEFDINGDLWPNTPDGDTVINTTCLMDKVGYKSRTCESTIWQPVFYYCINKELSEVGIEADNFLKGLNSTHEIAMNIFSGLKNSSTTSTDPSEYIADINASISILNVMASASTYIALQYDVLPNLVTAASNMLNKSWTEVNQSVIYEMSSNYLESIEGLVENIQVNNGTKNVLDNENVELKFCSRRECNVSLFGIDLSLNLTTGILKTIAVKNLMDKLRNNFPVPTVPTSLLLSATLQDNNGSSLQITMQFPKEKLSFTKPHCVFWNTTMEDWSDEGCVLVKSSNGNQTFCKCGHLTSFSVLMAKEDISNKALDIITYVGLTVSICSLLIFLTVEYLVWSAVVKSNLSYFRHTAMVNIATFLLLADCCFLASPKGIGETLCLTLTVCKHLFFLAMFSWTMCLSVMLVHQLIFVFSPLRKRVFMFLSSILGYVCPILIVGCSYTYCKYTDTPYYHKDTCWLVFKRLLEGSIHAFLLPIGTAILTNVFALVVVIVTLVKSSAPDSSKADDKETAKGIIKVVVFLTPVFGLTWIIGFALLLLNKDNPMFTVANYSFTILNSFQGLFLLITGCIAEQKVRQEMLKIILAKTKGKSESTTNLTSTTYTKDK